MIVLSQGWFFKGNEREKKYLKLSNFQFIYNTTFGSKVKEILRMKIAILIPKQCIPQDGVIGVC